MKVDESKRNWYSALGRIASGLFVVTMRHGEAETGMLASWVQQCSFDPPLLTMAVAPKRFIAEWLAPGAEFTLNVLDESQTDMIAHFGKGFSLAEDAFQGLEVNRSMSVAPVLSEIVCYIDCRVHSRYTPGDHELIVAEVIGGGVLGEGHPMVHSRKSGAHY